MITPLSRALGERASAPLARHALFQTRDLDEARERVSAVYCPHQLRFAGEPRHRGDTCMSHLPVGGISVNRLRYGATVAIDAGCLEDFLLVMMPLDGCAEVGCGDARIRSTPRLASVITPTRPLRETVEANCDQLMIRIDRALLERSCAAHLGHALPRPVEFELGLDMGAPHAHGWLSLVSWLVMAADSESPLLASPLLRAQTEQTVVTTLLLTQPHTFSRLLEQPAAAAAPAHVRRAEDYIQSHAEQPVSLTLLAELTGVSTRALQAGFREFRGTSPMAYLKSVRLQRVREDLERATPATDSVTAAALRWGFQHLGHFTTSYRQQFGESPSRTLRRGG